MTNTAIGLVGYIGWTLLLLCTILGLRAVATLRGTPANGFSTTGEDQSPFAQRLARVHLNAVEGFPIFGGILLVALVLEPQAQALAVTEPLALWILGARLVQGCCHLASTSVAFVIARFSFLLVQVGCAIVALRGFVGLL